MTDQILIGAFVLYAIVFVVMLLIARAIFSIHTILYHQKVMLKVLEGIAIKQGVDPAFLNRKV